MSKIEFSKDENTILIRKLQLYFKEELNQEIGQFDTQFLLDYISEEIGAYFYNRGLYDAQSVFDSRIESITEAIYDIELATEFLK